MRQGTIAEIKKPKTLEIFFRIGWRYGKQF